jgi:hypothetical protein
VPNDNVKMVFSGHYHSAQKTVSRIDSDGDGKADRNVLNLLFDYQAMDEGGMGFLRLMHVNTKNATMEVRTYSPSIHKYGSQTVASSSFTPSDEQFTVDLKELGVQPQTADSSAKRLATDAFAADLQGSTLIASAKAVSASGSAEQQRVGLVRGLSDGVKSLSKGNADALTATVTWKNASAGTHGWYAVVTNQYGGSTTTAVSYVSAAGKTADVEPGGGAGTGGNGANNGNGASGAHGTSGADAQAKAGKAVTVVRGGLARTGVNAAFMAIAVAVLAALGVGLRWLKAVKR